MGFAICSILLRAMNFCKLGGSNFLRSCEGSLTCQTCWFCVYCAILKCHGTHWEIQCSNCFHFALQAGRENWHCQVQNPIKNNRLRISNWTRTFCYLICWLLATYLLLFSKDYKNNLKAQKASYISCSSNKTTFGWCMCSFAGTFGLNFPEKCTYF